MQREAVKKQKKNNNNNYFYHVFSSPKTGDPLAKVPANHGHANY